MSYGRHVLRRGSQIGKVFWKHRRPSIQSPPRYGDLAAGTIASLSVRRHDAFGPCGLGHSAERPALGQTCEGLQFPLSEFALRTSDSQNSAGFAMNLPPHGRAFRRAWRPKPQPRRSLFRRAAADCNRPKRRSLRQTRGCSDAARTPSVRLNVRSDPPAPLSEKRCYDTEQVAVPVPDQAAFGMWHALRLRKP